MKTRGRRACEFAGGSAPVIFAALAFLVFSSAASAAGDQEVVSQDCIVRAIDLDHRDGETLLDIRTEGRPVALGARLEAAGSIVLDLSGCAPARELSDRSFPEGLVSALKLVHDFDTPGLDTTVVIETRRPFEYSVSSSPGVVSVVLRPTDRTGAAAAETQAELVRVLEPLPLPLPEPAAPEPAAPEPQPEATTPETLPPEVTAPPRPPTPDVTAQSRQPPPASEESAVADTVRDWAIAWSDQHVEDYLSAYGSGFVPQRSLSREAWEAQRRLRLNAPRFVQVTLDALQVRMIEPGWAVASFLQSYRSDTYSDRVDKSLTLIQEGGGWRIVEEQAGSPDPAAAARPGSAGREAESPTFDVEPPAAALVEGARRSIVEAPRYDASYRRIRYPGGDPGPDRGSAVDLVIRAYRHLGIDLQERIHRDILSAGAEYGIRRPDTNIDHRRIRNQEVFFRRHGRRLALDRGADWQPGDIVFWAVDGRRRPNHAGIVSDVRSPVDQPLVIHHREGGPPREQDVLFAWAVRGHYRWLPPAESE